MTINNLKTTVTIYKGFLLKEIKIKNKKKASLRFKKYTLSWPKIKDYGVIT